MHAFGGFAGSNRLNSLETLDLAAASKAWTMLALEGVPARDSALMCAISETEMLISGGLYENDKGTTKLFRDAYLYSTEHQQVVRKVSDDAGLAFSCLSPPIMQAKGTFVALVETYDSVLKMVRYSARTENFTVIETIGRCRH